jgi:hypothetical protein
VTPSANPTPLTYEQAETALREIGRQIRDAERRHRDQIQTAGNALADHKKVMHQAALRFRAEGKGAGEAEFLAKTAAADQEAAAYIAQQLVKATADELENRRGERASLHRLAEWSQRFNPTGEQLR